MNLIGPLICLLDLLIPSGSISMAMSASSLLAWSHSEHCLEKDERQRERVRKTKESGILLLWLICFHLVSWLSRSMSMFSTRSRCVEFIPTKGLLKYSAQTIYEIEGIAEFFSTSKSFLIIQYYCLRGRQLPVIRYDLAPHTIVSFKCFLISIQQCGTTSRFLIHGLNELHESAAKALGSA